MQGDLRLMDVLGRELLAFVQAGSRSPIAFCAIAGGSPIAASGWIAAGGVVSAMSERELAVLLAAAPDEGARERQLELFAGHDQLVVVGFDVQAMRVCAGVARRGDDPRFDAGELGRLRGLAPVAAQLGALRTRCFEHDRRDLVLRSLRNITDACCVLDLETRQIRWTYDLRDDQPCARDIYTDEAGFLELAEQFHRAASVDGQLPYAAVIGRTTVVRTADLGCPSEFDGARCLAVALAYFDGEPTKLSTRERQIAQLLASGYSTINAAAILSLSENTIRTYVRRLYRKLEITNRADLTRKCTELCLGML